MTIKNHNPSYFRKGHAPWNKGTGEMTNPKICSYCNKKFYNRVKNRKFCSLKCFYAKPISEETRNKLSQYHKKHPIKYWLNKKGILNIKDKNARWNGGKTKRDDYVLILSPNHPYKNNENYVREHRLIAEKILGRYLLPTEYIHHINGVKDDNRPENLYLFSNKNNHAKHHGFTNPPILTSNLIIKEL